jgi:predicted nucleic acid-binding Zn finger protein
LAFLVNEIFLSTMKIYISLITITFLLTSSLFGKIPSWFKKTPKTPIGVYLEVGYSTVYNNDKLSKQIAVYRAAKSIAKQKQLEMIFDLSTISDGRFILGRPDFEEIYEEDILNQVLKNCIVIDSIYSKKRNYFLVQYPASAKKIKTISEKVSWGNKPKWVNKPPKNKNYIYGLGQVAKYINFNRAWQETDSFARFDAGKSICINIQSIREEKQTDNYSTISSYKSQYYDIFIYDCKIIKIWYDKKNDAYYSLSKMPRNSYQIQ